MATMTRSRGRQAAPERGEFKDAWQRISEAVLEALSKGRVPWQQTWADASLFGPQRSGASGRVYTGANQFWLRLVAQAKDYPDPRWVTFKGALDLGGSVRKGEKATLVALWKTTNYKPKDADPDDDKTRSGLFLKAYYVFNVAQCDNLSIKPLVPTVQPDPSAGCAVVEATLARMKNPPNERHSDLIDGPYYHPGSDTVWMLPVERFKRPDDYWAAKLHEVAHSTGHKSRLARPDLMDVTQTGDDPYSREEMTAEAAALFVGERCGLRVAFDNSANYIANWARRIEADPRLVVTALGRAQKAADCIMGASVEEDAGDDQ
jgi:antirestriction protein ArdC